MRPVRILMVEDDPHIATMYCLKLELDGVQVRVAGSGGAALVLARERRWSLLILDMRLPDLDGLSVLAALRADIMTRDLPVVILSSLDDPRLVERGLALGAIDYLVKTRTTPAQLSRRVSAWTAANSSTAGATPVEAETPVWLARIRERSPEGAKVAEG